MQTPVLKAFFNRDFTRCHPGTGILLVGLLHVFINFSYRCILLL